MEPRERERKRARERERDIKEVDGGSVNGGRRARGAAAGLRGSWTELARGANDNYFQRR